MTEKEKIKDKIRTQLKEILEKNAIEKSFIPVIEEFFFRATEQCNWDDYDLKAAISNFQNVDDIRFINTLAKNIEGAVRYINKRNQLKIVFNLNNLKKILRYDIEGINEFINTILHELGHSIQNRRTYEGITAKYYMGISEYDIDEESGNVDKEQGVIANEYAEVINAHRLQYGNLSVSKYFGYQHIQNPGKVMLSSLGITETEFANLQYKGKQKYRKFVASRLGSVPSNLYIDSFEKILDTIDILLRRIYTINFFSKRDIKRNLILQIDALQSLSKEIFEER